MAKSKKAIAQQNLIARITLDIEQKILSSIKDIRKGYPTLSGKDWCDMVLEALDLVSLDYEVKLQTVEDNALEAEKVECVPQAIKVPSTNGEHVA